MRVIGQHDPHDPHTSSEPRRPFGGHAPKTAFRPSPERPQRLLNLAWLPVVALTLEARASRSDDPTVSVGIPCAFAFAACLALWTVEVLATKGRAPQGEAGSSACRYARAGVCGDAALAVSRTAFALVGCVSMVVAFPGLDPVSAFGEPSGLRRACSLLGSAALGCSQTLGTVLGSRIEAGPKTDHEVAGDTLSLAGCWIAAAYLATYVPVSAAAAAALACEVLAAAFFFARPLPAAGEGAPSRKTASPTNLTRQKALSLENRFAAAALALGFSFASMADQFSPTDPVKDMHWGWLPLLGALCFAVVLMAFDFARKGEPDYWFDYRLCILFAIVAFFPFNSLNYLGIRFAFWSLEWCFLLSTVFLALIALTTRERLRDVVAVSSVTPFVSFLGGAGLGLLFSHAYLSLDETNVRVGGLIALVLLFCATNLLVKNEMVRSIQMTQAGVTPLPETHEDHRGSDDYVRVACRDLAARYVLSDRELDVLFLLARGHSLARIQEELFISEGTAATHRRHVYKKLEVHSKQELIELVEMYRTDGKAA